MEINPFMLIHPMYLMFIKLLIMQMFMRMKYSLFAVFS